MGWGQVMKRFLLACCATTLLSMGAMAQAEEPPTPDAGRLALAREVMAATGGVQTYETQLKTMFGGISALTKSISPKETPAMAQLRESMFKYVLDEEVKALPQMLDDMASIYAEHLTEAELRDLLAWYKSESGRSIRAKMPVIALELVQKQAPLMQKMRDGILSQAIARACEENHCTTEQRQTLTALVHKTAPAT